jgi:putative ABC transport system ATP-binding protein
LVLERRLGRPDDKGAAWYERLVSAETAEGATAALRVRGLVKSYALGASRVEVLRGLDLVVPPGETCAVMGPSGAGKSTLLRCIAGLEAPDQGAIEVLGEDLARLDDHGRTLIRRRRIGVIYQFFNLVANLSAIENVRLPYLIDGVAPDEAAVRGAIERVGMTARADHFPAQLSGGEMQLVSIARAVVRRPALVLADEPTGNVNVATGRRIMALLAEAVRETSSALVLVTHNPEDAARADRVVFLQDGEIRGEATLGRGEVSSAAVHDRLKALGI